MTIPGYVRSSATALSAAEERLEVYRDIRSKFFDGLQGYTEELRVLESQAGRFRDFEYQAAQLGLTEIANECLVSVEPLEEKIGTVRARIEEFNLRLAQALEWEAKANSQLLLAEARHQESLQNCVAELASQRRAQDAERLEAERLEAERLEAERLAACRLAGEQQGRLAEQEALWRQRKVRAAMVVAALGVVAGIVTTVWMNTGSGKTDKGKAFGDSADGLSTDALGGVQAAAPTVWSGRAADHYGDQGRAQQARVQALAEADRTVADIVAAQADQVEQARLALEITVGVLGSAIVVAMALTKLWELYYATPMGKIYEAILVGFGTAAALSAIGVVITELVSMDDAGRHTQTALASIMQIYQGICDGVADAVQGRRAVLTALWGRHAAVSSSQVRQGGRSLSPGAARLSGSAAPAPHQGSAPALAFA